MDLEKTLESPLDRKEIQPVHPKGNQSWVFIGRTDVEAETPILWPPDMKNWLSGKDPDAEKDWRQEEKGVTEDEMVGWHHWLDGCEFEQALGVGDGQGGAAVHGVTKSWTQLSGWTELDSTSFPGGTVVKNMPSSAGDAGDVSSIPGLMGKIPWRRKWQPTPVFLPGKSHGQRSLVDYSPWGHKELDTAEHTHTHKRHPNDWWVWELMLLS